VGTGVVVAAAPVVAVGFHSQAPLAVVARVAARADKVARVVPVVWAARAPLQFY